MTTAYGPASVETHLSRLPIGFLEIAVNKRSFVGSSKVVVQHIEIKEPTGSLQATPSTPSSAILVPWNPDDSWKRDALLRVNAVLGPPTRTHTVFEHLDVMVHPLGIHLVEPIAQSFWVRQNIQFHGLQAASDAACI